MRDKYLKVMMTEEELNEVKEFTKKIGFKNASETARESLKVFKAIKEKEPKDADNFVKMNDASCILWASRLLCTGFDIQNYFSDDKKEVPEEYGGMDFDTMLVNMYNDGYFDSLKECVLASIYHDLIFSNEINEKTRNLIKNISVEFLKKS